MKNKKKLIIMSLFLVILIIISIILAIVQKSKKSSITNKIIDYFVVEESKGKIFKGVSIIDDEQKIFIEKGLKIEKVHILDKNIVNKGDKIITYYDESIEEKINSVKLQYDSVNEKLYRESNNEYETKKEIEKKENLVDEKTKRIYDIKQIEKKTSLQQEIDIEKQEIRILKSNLQGQKATVISLKDSLKDLKKQLKSLESKLRTDIVANIDGIAYINKKGLNDNTVEYISIISKNTLIKGEATEYDILDLYVGKEMLLKIISTGEEIKGTVISVNDLPVVDSIDSGVIYNFNIKPEKFVKVGFSVKIKEDNNILEIPKDYVAVDGEKLIVLKINDNGLEKIEVTGTLDSDYYTISSDKIKPKDKLRKNPLEYLNEGK